MKSRVLFLLLLNLVKGEARVLEEINEIAPQSITNSEHPKNKLIVCYYATWKHNNTNGNPCTHIIYAFVPVSNDGTIPNMNEKQRGKNSLNYISKYIKTARNNFDNLMQILLFIFF